MKYKCLYCLAEIDFLETDGDEIFKDFICQDCSVEIEQTLQRAREIQHLLIKHLERKK